MGASYGGYTVLACLTRQPALWAVGVDIVGIANFETFFKHTGPWRRRLRASEYGDPVKDAALLRKLSPIHRIDRIRAPLMVLQGANDPRVPQEESDQMVEQLRARNHPVEYLLFPDEGHGIVKIPNRIKAYTAIGEFLDRHLMPTQSVGDGNPSTP
jgi:dipeptidyl aminopeptidase/acylaminoacyl peptidase